MNNELQNKLFELAPILYQEKDLDVESTCMCWGFECPDTWFELLSELTIQLEKINNTYKDKFEIIAHQVKEKYGYLHFYYSVKYIDDSFINTIDDEILTQIDALISDAELKSRKICCECGQPATKISKGWIMYYCDKCFTRLNLCDK